MTKPDSRRKSDSISSPIPATEKWISAAARKKQKRNRVAKIKAHLYNIVEFSLKIISTLLK